MDHESEINIYTIQYNYINIASKKMDINVVQQGRGLSPLFCHVMEELVHNLAK